MVPFLSTLQFMIFVQFEHSAIRSGLSVDPIEFGKFCDDFVQKFKNDPSLNWYQFSPTLHKVLWHGKEAIEFFPLPISWLSEVSF